MCENLCVVIVNYKHKHENHTLESMPLIELLYSAIYICFKSNLWFEMGKSNNLNELKEN